jgi:UDP-N-acetylglucosamine diphosphorylase/glucosamine-1-phosphate N-acetyltransferase
MNFVLFDEEPAWKNFLPLTFTRPLSEIRIGILTVKEKWDNHLNTDCSYHSQAYLSKKFPLKISEEFVLINSRYCPDEELTRSILNLKPTQALLNKDRLLAINGQVKDLNDLSSFAKIEYTREVFEINNVWDIFQKNHIALTSDFKLVTANRTSQPLSSSVTVVGDRDLVFLEQGAKAEACILNTTTGPIYIGKDAEIMEGSAIRGPFALCEHSTLKLNAKIYGATTIGPHCKVGGEVSNCVIFGYTNKAHDGFIGNSVIGEWCNLGADTNSSNLKNNYGNVKLFNYVQNKQVDTGLQFCGLIMGDHSRSGINTMFNTGTVVGVGCNIYGGGFPSTSIRNFSWGGSEGFEPYKLQKLFETAEKVFERRNLKFNDTEKNILNSVFEKNL